MAYQTEKDFARALTAKFKKLSIDYQKIESHGTANGIPDMFVQNLFGDDTWIELKNCPKVSVFNHSMKIPYRPGQMSWLHEYTIRHYTYKCGLTLISLLDGLAIVRNTADLNSTEINLGDREHVWLTDLKEESLKEILYYWSRPIPFNDNYTIRANLRMFYDKYDCVNFISDFDAWINDIMLLIGSELPDLTVFDGGFCKKIEQDLYIWLIDQLKAVYN